MVDQYVLRFEIAMQYAFGVDIGHPVQYLLDYRFYFLLIYLVLLAGYVLLQVEVEVIKNDFQLPFFGFVDHVDERYNVGMLLESFEECDLP